MGIPTFALLIGIMICFSGQLLAAGADASTTQPKSCTLEKGKPTTSEPTIFKM